MSEISYQEALEYAGLDSQCSSCVRRFLSADQVPCVCCLVINNGARINYFKRVLEENKENRK